MKKLNLLLAGVALVLGGCSLGPHMRMTVPEGDAEGSADYNGIKVVVHSIEKGDFGTGTAAAGDSSKSDFGDLAELIVDSLPSLEYRIGPLDMVQVVVWEHPELTSPMGQYQPAGQRVTTDGTLFYPYAGVIQAAGLTAQELRTEITKRLSDKILNDPQVDVRVTGYNSLKAFVSGAVNKPGYIAFNELPMTIPAAIAGVGGFAEEADPAGMQLRRGDKVYNINYLDAFKANLPLDKILLKPDDQIFIPALTETQKENRVYVMGEVARTGAVNVNQGKLSLVEALASAGGLNTGSASARLIYVIRNTSDKQIDVYHLNAKNAMALAMAERFNLNARDVVYVDASDLATWNRIMNLIVPSSAFINNGASAVRNIELIELQGW
ncbi:polysaccharide export outer membrane protein [Fibrobacter sp. UWT3]|uniref:polysaccharide biosynthesis/export family protein n=1 Tax=Fibrobacter sp. UWT3 TaxID=1896225 RepID=UPI000BCA8C95|nr:polysaccharide biosynthesis/export family protein [Fibrobacter sp. UWT3]SOE46541.1 polysaccharide export outer membrane protein [Fibrobacter sp. UWT3]